MGRKILDFIDAELKNQVIGLQLATEIELYPENSVITRYWNIELVNDNKAWIPRFIELHGPTLGLILTSAFPPFVIDFNLLGLKLSRYISTPWMYGSRGALCKAGVSSGSFLEFIESFCRKRCCSREKIQESTMGPKQMGFKASDL